MTKAQTQKKSFFGLTKMILFTQSLTISFQSYCYVMASSRNGNGIIKNKHHKNGTANVAHIREKKE